VLTTVAATLANNPPPELPGFLNVVGGQLNHYGYWALLLLVLIAELGLPVPGETILIAGAIFAGADGDLPDATSAPIPSGPPPAHRWAERDPAAVRWPCDGANTSS
jgi:hypothetical protein